MTGASLGLRSGSYGSVQQHSGAVLSTQSPPYLLRKPSKISLSGPRERERILPRICNFAGRRKVRMLLLLVASAAVLSFITVVSKGLAYDTKRVGLWKIVVVRNLPYVDARRNGKVPKLLLHRLFPNARFSLWIDGKLELVVDPYQVLERFLWRKNYTFAISRHYRRFDVFEEAEANKAAGKYDNSSIDYQIKFYKKEGLTPYSSSKLPITSGDTVRDKIMSRVNWTINMFMDCERRNFVVQAYHRDLLEQRKSLAALVRPPPPALVNDRLTRAPPSRKLPGKISMRRGRDKRPGSRRHHPRTAGATGNR
ncbi:hypothetical protein BHE74_00032325 [Ensete ventricosum]|uniref:Uncharacterized protein n=1 Tax=Ensete ventricosum TaxID=4639 RepID=A0A426ZJF3_ENSVE|nr:hypothetical protein B296_00030049 [Ensete ventricosum]RWW18636.1 hypothetical protein GW17_00017361 [Ensete ventricosum]RWW60662.1 hypothetical protein BHE74_00032325 [Ensete ventricosum]RZS09503.1 hypothetical protein BHM03_00040593 [Ensete ventricosum]